MSQELTQQNRVLVDALVQQVQQGQILEAFERFYADNVSMQENTAPATVGKDANRAREEQFVASVAQVHENRANSVLVDGDQAVIHWVTDYTNTDGMRLKLDQLALQTWANGQIVNERFVYDTNSVVQS